MKNYLFSKYIYTISLFLLASILFVSCEKEIEIDLNTSEPKVVIEGMLQLDSLAVVKISKSQNYNQQGGFSPVVDAVVTLSDNKGNVEVLEQNIYGVYSSKNIRGVVGDTYDLVVSVGGVDYTSSSTMPKLVKIRTLSIYYVSAFDVAYPIISFQDIPGEENYYKTVLYVNGSRVRQGIDVTDDKDRDGTVISFIQTYNEDDLENETIDKGDIITVNLQCIDKGAYTYFETLGRIQSTLSNPTSNITGGALGYFSAYTSDTKSIVAKW